MDVLVLFVISKSEKVDSSFVFSELRVHQELVITPEVNLSSNMSPSEEVARNKGDWIFTIDSPYIGLADFTVDDI